MQMANLIETLIGGAVKREDDNRLTITRRPVPYRPRHLFELFIAMGNTASFQGLHRSIDFKGADPLTITFAALGRWPTPAEAAAFTEPYKAALHLMTLLRSAEFRAGLPRRICEAFPERKRLLFLSIPRSASAQVIATLDSKHPLIPLDLTHRRYNDTNLLAETLGQVLSRMNSSNALAMVQPHLRAFANEPDATLTGPDPLAWFGGQPPSRPGDLIFAIFRDPAARALGQINAQIAAYRAGEANVPDGIHEAASVPRQNPNALRVPDWRGIGRALIASGALLNNPVCTALADGTEEGARAACRRVPVQLVPPQNYNIWARTAFDTIPSDPTPPAEPILRPEDLTPAEREMIDAATAEDRALHARLTARIAATGIPSVSGYEL
jgi:hypothetical protein